MLDLVDLDRANSFINRGRSHIKLSPLKHGSVKAMNNATELQLERKFSVSSYLSRIAKQMDNNERERSNTLATNLNNMNNNYNNDNATPGTTSKPTAKKGTLQHDLEMLALGEDQQSETAGLR